MKRALALMLILLCALMMTGCMPLSINLQRDDQVVLLPTPGEQENAPAIGDSLPSASYYLPLHFVSADKQRLIPFSRAVTVSGSQSLVRETLLTLLGAEHAPDAFSPFPEGTRLLGVERNGNLAVVDLSIDARNVESEQQYLWMREAIAATIVGLEGIEYVNVLVAGRDEGLLSLPSGCSQGEAGSMAAAWMKRTAERELLDKGGETPPSIVRSAVIYYAAQDGQYIAPVVKDVRVTDGDYITPVIEALMNCEGETGSLRSPFPQETGVLKEKPEIVETGSGRRMVRLTFDANLVATLEREELSAWQLYASLTYTLTGFVPEIDGLIVLIGDGQLAKTERGDQELTFTGGEMNRAVYPDAVCRLAATYMNAADGGLLRLYRPLDQRSAVSPRALLGELFDGPAEWEEGAARVMPDGVSIDDILGIRITDQDAIVNLSSNFYRCCQSLTAQQERNMIYAMVNTLTELPLVDQVSFQVEGETVDHLVSSVFLRGPLMRSPGIIR